MLAPERDATKAKVEVLRVEPEVRRLVVYVGQVDVAVLRHRDLLVGGAGTYRVRRAAFNGPPLA